MLFAGMEEDLFPGDPIAQQHLPSWVGLSWFVQARV